MGVLFQAGRYSSKAWFAGGWRREKVWTMDMVPDAEGASVLVTRAHCSILSGVPR
jgi:hypothetical protein